VECSPGGKGLNVASFAHTLGAQVLATGILAGHTGRHVQDLLAARGIAGDFVWTAGESRSCHIIHDPEANTLTQIREPGPSVPPGTRAAVVDKVRGLAARAQVVVMSGSLPPGLETAIYRELVAAVRAQDVPVILDAAGPALALGLEAGPTLIKPNLHELADLAARLGIGGAAGGPLAGPPPARDTHPDPAEAAAVRRWAAAAARAVQQRFGVRVAASLGPLGAVVADGPQVYAVVPPPVEAVNTISCGDALVAGIAVGWTRGQALDEAVRLGVAAATAKALLFETGRVDPDDVARLLPRTEIVSLD